MDEKNLKEKERRSDFSSFSVSIHILTSSPLLHHPSSPSHFRYSERVPLSSPSLSSSVKSSLGPLLHSSLSRTSPFPSRSKLEMDCCVLSKGKEKRRRTERDFVFLSHIIPEGFSFLFSLLPSSFLCHLSSSTRSFVRDDDVVSRREGCFCPLFPIPFPLRVSHLPSLSLPSVVVDRMRGMREER